MDYSDRKNNTPDTDCFTPDMDLATFRKLIEDELLESQHLHPIALKRITNATFENAWRNPLCRTPGMIKSFIQAKLAELIHLN